MPIQEAQHSTVRLGTMLAFLVGLCAPASAHPHVWINSEVTVVYESGQIKELQHKWSFDEFYTTMAIEGLDKNNDSKYDREELSELAKVNMDGLKEFNYFTSAQLRGKEVGFSEPTDSWLEHKDGILSLYFTLPVAEPAATGTFSFAVSDPSFFIAFEFAKQSPVRLVGAPGGCRADMAVPEKDVAAAQRLGDAFSQQLGGPAGLSLAKTVTIRCPAP